MPDLTALLKESSTIAVVGCSDRPDRDSFRIARYLQDVGYTVIPVNPNINGALGLESYPDLERIPKDVNVDIVNIFRRPSTAADMVRDAVARADIQHTAPAVWVQLGVHTPEAEAVAKEAGLDYVSGSCIRVVHQVRLG